MNTGEPLAKVLIWRQQGSAKGDFSSFFLKKAKTEQPAKPFFSISDGLLPHRLFSCSLTISNQ
jgi:hypothetical protein